MLSLKALFRGKARESNIFLRSFFSSQFNTRYEPFINGSFAKPGRSSDRYFDVCSPSTTKKLCEVADCDGTAALSEAVENAQQVFDSGVWSRADVRARASVLSNISIQLKEAIPELLLLEVAQTGRAVREMRAQVI